MKVLALALWLALCLPLAALLPGLPASAAVPLPDLQAEAASWVDRGQDEPDEALRQLAALRGAQAADADADRALLLAQGLVLAGARRVEQAEAAIAALSAIGAASPMAAADALLVRAALADSQAHGGAVLLAAQQALDLYQRLCGNGAPRAAGCDHRSRWRALQSLSRHHHAQGRASPARQHALAAAELASEHGDTPRQALSLAAASLASVALGERDAADRHAKQALRLSRLDGSPVLLARIALFESVWRQAYEAADGDGDGTASRRAAERGLVWARRAQSPRLESMLLANLSDSWLRAGQPHRALAAIEPALAIATRLGDRTTQHVLRANAMLARFQSGNRSQIALARSQLEALLADMHAAVASAAQAQLLREAADVLAAAGDTRGALDLYHRERRQHAELMAAGRDAALSELRERFDREAQQRRLEQLGRDNTLIAAQLANRQATQKLWIGAACVGALALVLVALLYGRVRRIHRELASSHEFLRVQSERDPLTGLGNRRSLIGLLDAERGAPVSFSGTLLLVDVDHFKRINDRHGHAGGDCVLVEVARRLQAVVREGDRVVRWGGEEFLIVGASPDDAPGRAEALATRVLQTIGGVPFEVGGDGLAIPVTVSVGYGSFPVAPLWLPMPLDEAINRVDMALYTAKNQGRNRAVGIDAVRSGDPALNQAEFTPAR